MAQRGYRLGSSTKQREFSHGHSFRGEQGGLQLHYHDANASRELRITVEEVKDPQQAMTAYRTRCGSGPTPLRAIGNEAVTCAADTKGKTYGQQVIGRVRDQIFTVTLTTSAKNDPFMPREALEEKARNIAEQVAGALF